MMSAYEILSTYCDDYAKICAGSGGAVRFASGYVSGVLEGLYRAGAISPIEYRSAMALKTALIKGLIMEWLV